MEFDVQLTKDLVPVVYHDFTVCTTLARVGLPFSLPLFLPSLPSLSSLFSSPFPVPVSLLLLPTPPFFLPHSEVSPPESSILST